MPMFDDKHVKAEGCYLLWDSITRPENNESGQKWGLKVAIHPSNPDAALLEQLSVKCLQESEFKGHLPNGGTMPLGTLGPNEYQGMFNGWRVFNCGTYRGVPDMYCDNQRVDLMQVGNLLYGGQMVDVLVHCYSNNKKVKGIAFGLDGVNVQAAQNAQRLNLGNGPSVDTSKAFGGGGQPAQAAPAAAAPSPSPQTAAAPAAGAPAASPAPAAGPAASAPAQAHNFLPGGAGQPAQPGAAPGPAAAPAAAAPVDVKRQAPDGVWTESQLRAAGWPDAQINALPIVQ